MSSSTGDDVWRRIDAVSPEELEDATLQLHWALQLVASAGQTFAEPAEDDRHRATTWMGRHSAFVGAPFAGPYPFRVGLRPADLTLILLDRTGETLSSFPLMERTREDGYAWLSLGMATYRGGAPPLIERPTWDIPEHPVGGDAPFSVASDDALDTLTALYGSADAILDETATARSDASEVVCWPHHFDIATLLTLETDDDGSATRTIGVGLAPGEGSLSSWYWYVTPWPRPDVEALPALESPGRWHTDGWVGAVLPGSDLTRIEAGRRADTVRAFLDDAIPAVGRLLGG